MTVIRARGRTNPVRLETANPKEISPRDTKGTDGEDNHPQLPCQKSALPPVDGARLFPRNPNVETRGAHRGPSAALFRGRGHRHPALT